jgi:hypothetical protein
MFFRRSRTGRPASPPPGVRSQNEKSGPARWEVLVRDYDMLRQDDRTFITVMVALGSVLAIVGGTSAFFLLRSCAASRVSGCHSYGFQVYLILPGPTLAGCALLVQQATDATIRGRIMLALEEAIVAEERQTFKLGGGKVPAFTTYHLQQPLIHGPRGAALWTLMFTLPFVAILGMIYYCGTEFHDVAKWIYYGAYLALVGILAWGGSPTFRGYSQMDSWLVRYLETERSKGKVQL